MSIEIVLNELSHQIPAEDIYTARDWLSLLRKTVQAATDRGVKGILRTERILYEIQIGPNYNVSNWLHDNQVDRDERNYIRMITTKSPYLQDVPLSDIIDTVKLSEFFFQNKKANGFRYAYLMNNLTVSFLSNVIWDMAIIDDISFQCLDSKTGDFLEEKKVSINHASRPEHLFRHTDWIAERIQDSISDGHDIWYRKEELYPNLRFCDSIRRQLFSIHSSHLALRQIKERLSELESNCVNWTKGTFNPDNLRGNPRQESETTLNQYGGERTFMCPDGNNRVFSWHVSINPGAWRLHFFPIDDERKIIIGYIGKHLSLATEN